LEQKEAKKLFYSGSWELARLLPQPSWPGLTRPSTPYFLALTEPGKSQTITIEPMQIRGEIV
jgi:hypothetical protein